MIEYIIMPILFINSCYIGDGMEVINPPTMSFHELTAMRDI